MNETRRQVLQAARRQFARHGYDAASVRNITRAARANLGAVTYYFESKQKLYLEVLQQATQPLRERIEHAAATQGSPLQRIEQIIRAFFEHLAEHPDMPALILRELALERPIPLPVRAVMGSVFASLRGCLEEGQRDGSIVSGDVRHLAIGIVSQPIYTALAQRPLREVLGLGLQDSTVRAQMVDDVVRFVRRALSSPAKGEER
jgi:AcrR family transcriptional regulator